MRDRRNQRHRAGIACLLGLALVAAACGDAAEDTPAAADADADPDAPSFDLSGTTLRLGSSQPEALGMGIHYAVDQLEGWGAEVEHEYLTSVTGIEAIVADQLDVAASSADEVLLGVAEGAEVTAISAPTSTMHYALVTGPDIESVDDLEDATLAISSPGSFNALLLRLLLTQEGLDPDAPSYVQIGGTGERAAAMLTGQADAAVVYVDTWLELQGQTDDVQLLGYVADLIPGLPSRLYYGADTYFADNPEMPLAIACANLNANAWIGEDKDAFVAFTEQEVEAASAEAVGAFYDVAQDIEMYPTDPEAVIDVDALQTLTDAMVAEGELSEEVDLETLVDASYMEEAAEMGCGA